MNRINIGGYNRISKARARAMYNQNKDIYICPVKLSPVSPWQGATRINRELIEEYDRSFENVMNHFEYYYCNNETGNYLAFYEREEATI